jgi:hypothetical protein
MRVYDMNNYARRLIETDITGMPVKTIFNTVQAQPEIPICVWDGKFANSRRRNKFAGYKAKRTKPTDDVFASFDMLKELLKLSKAVNVECAGWEGDDVIATLVGQMPGRTIHIHTTDVDLMQLPGVTIDREKAPVPVKYIRLYKTLVGDHSDNLHGIKGFGAKKWDAMPDEIKDRLLEMIPHEDWVTYLDKQKVLTKANLNWLSVVENHALINTFWDIVGLYTVPNEALNAGTIVGCNAPAAAWQIMKEFFS